MEVMNNNGLRSDNSGFSLMELLLALAIGSFVILAVYGFVMVGTKSFESAEQKTKVQKEMQFADNIIADYVMQGRVAETRYVDNENIRLLYTGNEVFLYNQSTNTLAIYLADDEDALGENIEEHIVSDCMTDFEVSFIKTEVETETEETEESEEPSTEEEEEEEEEEEDGVYATSNLIRIITRYQYKSEQLKSANTYMIRN